MKGIIMSGNHPRLILDNTKTMTRRVIKLACELDETYNHKWVHFNKKYNEWEYKGRSRFSDLIETFILKCPYGQVGDGLVIKEIWATENQYNHLKPSEIPQTAKIWYRTDEQYNPQIMGKVRSSMFMCHWMSRAKPVITEVRVERLQEISWRDCKREGADPKKMPFSVFVEPWKDAFERLWDSLNAKYNWQSNPWVWVISFQVVRDGE